MISIITPYFKTYEQTKKLASILIPQLTNETEWIIIDDGTNDDFSYINSPYVKVIHLKENSGGASVPRNKGLDVAKGEYISFIDSDDLVSEDYIQTILENLKGQDYMFISWTYIEGDIIIKNEPPSWNCCIWNCIYKRSLIGNERFDTNLVIAEDYDFNKRVRHGTHNAIQKILYYYQFREGSLTKKGDDIMPLWEKATGNKKLPKYAPKKNK